MFNASGSCPGHLILHLFTKTVNHNLMISFNYFSGGLLGAIKAQMDPRRYELVTLAAA